MYLANTKAAVERVAREAGLVVESIQFIEGPTGIPPAIRSGIHPQVGYERLVNMLSILEPFRVVLIAALRKPGSA